ncbi:MAG: sensor histidine kinase [Microcoleaceae cyanobacterium]
MSLSWAIAIKFILNPGAAKKMTKRSLQALAKPSFRFYGLLTAIFLLTILMEYTTPSAFVFSYLYIGAILLANYKLSRQSVMPIALIAAALTLINLVFPTSKIDQFSIISNRVIASISLVITGWLCVRNRIYEEQIILQRAQIYAQENLSRIREDFVSTLTHDLKTPLLGAIETLKYFQSGHFGLVTPMQQKVLDMMCRSHQSTLQLVETVLDIYRIDAEGLQLHWESVNLTTLLEEIVTTLTDLAQSRRVYIRLSHSPPDTRKNLWIKGDSLQLKRVFLNLLSNAINHSPRGSSVEIILTSKDNQQYVSILDQGLGITDSELPQIFERFYQGHSNRQAKGSGLGLYLSRQIVEAHDGKIWARNRSTGGAIFGCCLPACWINADES